MGASREKSDKGDLYRLHTYESLPVPPVIFFYKALHLILATVFATLAVGKDVRNEKKTEEG